MENIVNRISIKYSDQNVNSVLRNIAASTSDIKPYFNQNEEMFFRLNRNVIIPSLPVHHDIRYAKPGKAYLSSILRIVKELSIELPFLFADLQYYFDPAEVLHPCFFRVFKIKDCSYLYLLRLDLSYRNSYASIINSGNNDLTPAYTTNALFYEADIIPLSEIRIEGDRFSDFIIDQVVSQNWIGETGRGYMVQGIWIDHELTKFFSKLFTPSTLRMYPYYPFSCKYRTFCHTLIDPSPDGRKSGIPKLHRALETVRPWMDYIQKLLKTHTFDPEMKGFKTLKASVPDYWNSLWDSFTFKAYLNEADMKEFSFGN